MENRLFTDETLGHEKFKRAEFLKCKFTKFQAAASTLCSNLFHEPGTADLVPPPFSFGTPSARVPEFFHGSIWDFLRQTRISRRLAKCDEIVN